MTHRKKDRTRTVRSRSARAPEAGSRGCAAAAGLARLRYDRGVPDVPGRCGEPPQRPLLPGAQSCTHVGIQSGTVRDRGGGRSGGGSRTGASSGLKGGRDILSSPLKRGRRSVREREEGSGPALSGRGDEQGGGCPPGRDAGRCRAPAPSPPRSRRCAAAGSTQPMRRQGLMAVFLASEFVKQRTNRGEVGLCFYRDRHGSEIDLVVHRGGAGRWSGTRHDARRDEIGRHPDRELLRAGQAGAGPARRRPCRRRLRRRHRAAAEEVAADPLAAAAETTRGPRRQPSLARPPLRRQRSALPPGPGLSS